MADQINDLLISLKLKSERNRSLYDFWEFSQSTLLKIRLTLSDSFEVAIFEESVFFAAPEEPSMNRYGLWPYKPPRLNTIRKQEFYFLIPATGFFSPFLTTCNYRLNNALDSGPTARLISAMVEGHRNGNNVTSMNFQMYRGPTARVINSNDNVIQN